MVSAEQHVALSPPAAVPSSRSPPAQTVCLRAGSHGGSQLRDHSEPLSVGTKPLSHVICTPVSGSSVCDSAGSLFSRQFAALWIPLLGLYTGIFQAGGF